MDPTITAALIAALVSLAMQPLVEVPVALYVTRRKVRADTERLVAAARDQLKAELVAELKPGAMRGGVDPVALNEAKQLKREEREALALETEVEVKTFLAETFGPERVEQVAALLGEKTMARVYEQGKRWKAVLKPLIAKLPARQPDPAREVVAPTFEAPYG